MRAQVRSEQPIPFCLRRVMGVQVPRLEWRGLFPEARGRTPNDSGVTALQDHIKTFRPARTGPRNVYPIRKFFLESPETLWMECLGTHGFNCFAQRPGCFKSATACKASRRFILW